MRGVNKVTLVGNVGEEPEVKTVQENVAVAKFNLATTEQYTLKDGGSESKTQWHTIVCWRGLAQLAQQYIHKGSLLYIEGKINYRNYDDKEGNKKYVTEIVAEEIVLLDKKKSE